MFWALFALGVVLFLALVVVVLGIVVKGANDGGSQYLLGTRHAGSHPGLTSSDYSEGRDEPDEEQGGT
ncbi:MAG TPA: hypothetical protein VE646_04565 [Actinomycetota bacterium]|jgi:hypothetical protein|nr:hypothetical protein [Actinomycetota bacterium]